MIIPSFYLGESSEQQTKVQNLLWLVGSIFMSVS